MIKVLNAISDTNIAGAGKVLLNFMKLTSKTEFDHLVVVPKNALLTPEFKKLNVECFEIDGIADKTYSYSAIQNFIKLYKNFRPDIVHTHASLSARIAARLYGKCKIVHTRHSVFDQSELNKSLPMRLIKGGLNNYFSDVIIAVSPAAKENVVETGTNPKKVKVIFNGVETVKVLNCDEKLTVREQYKLSDNDFICAIMARLEDVKGHEYVIRAAKILRDNHYDNIKIMIAGTGKNEVKFRDMAKELGLKNCIFTGFLSNIYKLENIMDIQLNASYGTEATSMSLLEGMNLGVPAIVSDFGGNPYVIEDGKNGLVIPKQNPEEISNAIIKLYRDKDLYKKMSLNAVEMFDQKFTLKAMVENTEDVYKKLVSKGVK